MLDALKNSILYRRVLKKACMSELLVLKKQFYNYHGIR